MLHHHLLFLTMTSFLIIQGLITFLHQMAVFPKIGTSPTLSGVDVLFLCRPDMSDSCWNDHICWDCSSFTEEALLRLFFGACCFDMTLNLLFFCTEYIVFGSFKTSVHFKNITKMSLMLSRKWIWAMLDWSDTDDNEHLNANTKQQWNQAWAPVQTLHVPIVASLSVKPVRPVDFNWQEEDERSGGFLCIFKEGLFLLI